MKLHWCGVVFSLALCGCAGEIDDGTPPPFGSSGGSTPNDNVTGLGGAMSTGLGGGSATGLGGGASEPGAGSGGSTTTGGGGSTPDAGVPTSLAPYCIVQQMLRAKCTTCHANPPVNGAPMPLVAYLDLLVSAPTTPGQSVALTALGRIQNAARPMPPAPGTRATAAEIQALQDWIGAGTPQTSCTAPPPPARDAGTPARDAGTTTVVDSGARDTARPPVVDSGSTVVDPFAAARVCTSMQTWTGGTGASMRPGEPCMSCHGRNNGPNWVIAGTVYPTGHEPNDCNGVNAGAQVVITGANGAVLTLSVNSVGNFYSTTAVATPFRAKVVANGRERVMPVTQTDGNCNNCHTQTGANGAPGRIVLP